VTDPLCEAFRTRARATWRLVRRGQRVGVRLAEGTLTNLLLVGLSAFNSPDYLIRAHSAKRERLTGADWEMWLGTLGGPWLGIRIQAKAIDLSAINFPHLHFKGKGAPLFQTDTLIKDALSHNPPILPLYVLYTYVPNGLSRAWPCGSFPPDSEQYGCSLVSPLVVRNLRLAGGRDALVDLQPYMSPWHCLACCRNYGAGSLAQRALAYLNGILIGNDRGTRNLSPPGQGADSEGSLRAAEIEQLSGGYFEHRLWGAPPDYVAPILRGETVELPENLAAIVAIMEGAQAA
jgi:hypothetical protein